MSKNKELANLTKKELIWKINKLETDKITPIEIIIKDSVFPWESEALSIRLTYGIYNIQFNLYEGYLVEKTIKHAVQDFMLQMNKSLMDKLELGILQKLKECENDCSK